ncbi:unnamed protein product [Rhizophagus irregularis]|uniref:Uncharacterized protein n=1 Tax=Rhizophagus irregularis TaxID=588596 RepID=A0A915YZ01_9GLOM|nr:unnamed protein product [Rhizophagus irregularis]
MTYRIKEGHLGSSFESIGSNHHRPPPLVTEQVLREVLHVFFPVTSSIFSSTFLSELSKKKIIFNYLITITKPPEIHMNKLSNFANLSKSSQLSQPCKPLQSSQSS